MIISKLLKHPNSYLNFSIDSVLTIYTPLKTLSCKLPEQSEAVNQEIIKALKAGQVNITANSAAIYHYPIENFSLDLVTLEMSQDHANLEKLIELMLDDRNKKQVEIKELKAQADGCDLKYKVGD